MADLAPNLVLSRALPADARQERHRQLIAMQLDEANGWLDCLRDDQVAPEREASIRRSLARLATAASWSPEAYLDGACAYAERVSHNEDLFAPSLVLRWVADRRHIVAAAVRARLPRDVRAVFDRLVK